MHIEELDFDVDGEKLVATKVLAAADRPPVVVHLHGLGATANRHGVRYLLDELALGGTSSLTFDYSGNGDSTGELTGTTLGRRFAETVAAARHLAEGEPPVLLGTSMGAYLAAAAVPVLRPRALVLFVPAAYPAGCDDHPFDGTLVGPGAYPDSPAFSGLREFDGDLLILAARQDQVVPSDVVGAYLTNATSARTTRVVELDCDHFVHRWLPGRPAELARVHAELARIVTTTTTTH
ncbi:alpha/beta hydrolase [Actinosynnema sp. CS-041913]|uniref:alpha/beta hydrolase n=1 Tax=Actinosynnema sp. CS-041913 TaxID=3239917 RepID=UPI003D91FD8C